MSTSPKPEHVTAHEETAEFVGAEFDDTRYACANRFHESPELNFLAHYSQGTFDFSLSDPDIPPGRRSAMQRLGRHLIFTTDTLDRELQEEVRTGALIRVVLHTDRGAVLAQSVVPRQDLVAVCIDPFAAEHPSRPLSDAHKAHNADRAFSDLVTALRTRISLASQNPGGWSTAEIPTTEVTAVVGDPLVALNREPADTRKIAACTAAVRPDSLQFVAYCEDGDLAWSADHLGHPSLKPFFTQISVDARRLFYQGFSHRFGQLVSRLNRTVSTADPGGLLRRVVLDVEQGAIFYYRLGTGRYLVGVTVDQSRVTHADNRMAELAIECMGE